MAKSLTAEQEIAIKWLAKPRRGGKTYEDIAAICGVHPNTLAKWRKDPFFDAEFKKEIIRDNSDKLPELVGSLAEIAIRDGNAAMAKLALEVNGMLTHRVEVDTKDTDDTDVDTLMAKLAAFDITDE